MRGGRRDFWIVLIFVGLLTVLAFVSSGCASGAPAPEEEWNRTFGGPSSDYGFSVQQTIEGGYIIAGETASFGAGEGDVWLLKVTANGTEEWNRTFGGASYDSGQSVQQTIEGGYIVAGLTESFGAGWGDVWLLKVMANGTEEWNRTFGGPSYDYSSSVQQTIEGGYIIAGSTHSFGGGSWDVWLLKVAANGTEEWNRTFGGPSEDYGSSVQQTPEGSYIVGGETASFGAGERDLWLLKAAANGTEEWNRTFGGPSSDHGSSVQQTPEGSYIVGGETASFGAGEMDLWLLKAAANGTEEWNRTFGGPSEDYGSSVQLTTDGGYIIAGSTLAPSADNCDVWLIKTGADGTEEWNRTFGVSIEDRGLSVQQTADGGYIVAGLTASYVDPGDVWLLKVEGEPAALPVHNLDTVKNFSTIQAAIDDLTTLDGHTIMVDAGTYSENVVVNKRLTLIGADRNETIIDAKGFADVIDVSTSNCTISGFTLTNSGISDHAHSNCGVYCNNNSPTIINNIITGNNLGVGCWDGASPRIEDNIIKINTHDGTYAYSCSPVITKNIFSDNGGAGITLRANSSPIIINNFFINNTHGIDCNYVSGSLVTISDNYIYKNYDGISLEGSSNSYIKNNDISNNEYGIYMQGSSHNQIYNNYFNNTNNAVDNGDNIWNSTKIQGINIINGSSLGGNYWSDYTGEDTDGDGIGDTMLPYNSSGEIVNGGDRLPLVKAGNQPPTFNFTFANTCCFNVTFTGTGVDPDGTIVNHTWDFGDGSVSGVIAGMSGVITHQYETCGAKVVELSGYDNDGLYNFIHLPIYVDCGPTASAVALPSACFDCNGSMITFDGSASHADLSNTHDPRTITYSWTFSDGLTGDNDNGALTKRMVNETITATLTVSDGHCEDTSYIHIVPGFVPIFDTGEGGYPSLSGTFTGTITPSRNLTVSTLYTYNCKGTGGHTKSIGLYDDTTPIASGVWSGYQGDWHNVTFSEVTLLKNHEYRYVILTGSYPQIIHEPSWNATGGVITCTEFVDINGKQHEGWIPAIRLS